MHEMKEVGRSGDQSGGVVKKKSSSGCLIIKKKSGGNGVGIGGFSGGPSSRQSINSGKEKKRSRIVRSDSESSEEFVEPVRRKVVPGSDKFHNGSAVYGKSLMGNREIERERMRNGLDVFEFDEYERFDETIRKDFYEDRLKLYRHSGDPRDSGSGSSRIMVDKRKHSYLDSTSNASNAKSKSKYGSKSRFESEDDEAHLPISLLRERCREGSDEPIRVQGKNGVLKVMVNKKKNTDLPHRGYDHVDVKGRKDSRSEDGFKKKVGLPQKIYDQLGAEDRKASRSEDPIKIKTVMRPSFHSEKRPEKQIASVKMDKSEVKLHKSLSTKSRKETDDSDTALKLGSPNMRACTSAKSVKNEGTSTEKITPVKGKETKVKRGSGTEKQLLREKIRNMLLTAGWTIDYRPRRNRDYLDAVYINPSGTAYWSIIKAYEAFQKEEKTAVKPVGEFTPLPDEILSKLTRQTRKKREREMKKMKRDEGISRSSKKARVKEAADDMDSDQQDEKLSSYMKPNRKSLKGRSNEADHEIEDDLSDNLEEGTSRQDKVAKPSSGTMVQGRKSRKIGRTLVVRSSDKGLNSDNDGFIPYTGKRTLLSWLIDSGTVEMSEKVQYMNRRKTRAMLEGWITRDGIHCGCCSKILTVSKFELHAGSKLRLPFPNIFLQSGQSLMQCQIDAWNKQEESDRKGFHTVDIDGNDPNDDTCGLCGDGGDLICCDGCPSTFHQSCLNIKMLPKGDWHCPNCACKFCGIAGQNSTVASGGAQTALLMCLLCEKKYHESCSEGMDDVPADCGDATISFCGHKCRELYRHLLKLLGVKHELESGFSWTLLCRSDPSSDSLPLELSQKVECNSKLAIALSVMDECFLPIVDRRSRINLIHNVVYNCGSNFNRLNYSGFYTAILEKGDEIIAAASIRIHGTQLAEMPFIGTRHIYRRQGMCRRLLSAIESVLSSFKVEKLIIPAIAEHMRTWTDVFGFTPIEESLKQEMRSMNMLVFPGTDMLQKAIGRHKIPKENIALLSGENCPEVESNKLSAIKSELDSSNVKEINGKVASTESSPQATPTAPSDDSSSDTAHKPASQLSSKDSIPSNSLSDTSPGPNTGEPALDSPVKVDIQVPVLANRSKQSSSLGLDLNTYDDTEEQEEKGISDKVSDVDPGPAHAPCEPDPELFNKESVTLNAQADKKVAESATDLQGESTSDSNPVVLETPDPPIKENVQLNSKGSESKPEVQCISVSDPSAVALETPEPSVKEMVQLDSNGSESKHDLPSNSVSDASAAALETPEPSPVKEKVQLNNKGSESKPDVPIISVSDASAVALETPEPSPVKENVQLNSRGSESKPDLQCISVSNASAPDPPVKERVQLDCKGSESKPDLNCSSVSDASAVALETPEPRVNGSVQLDSKGSEFKPNLQCISVSDQSVVAVETHKPPPGKENVQVNSKGSESKPDLQFISVSDPSAGALETPEPPVEEKVQLESKGSESKPDLQCISVSDASAVALESPYPPPVKENVQVDTKGSESKPDLQSLSVSDPSEATLETPEPLVKEKVQLDGKGSESKPDLNCISVSDASAVALEPREAQVKENVQLDSKGSESKPDLHPMSVKDSSPVALETSEPPKENIQSLTDDSKAASLKLKNEILQEPNPAEEENNNPNPEPLSAVDGIIIEATEKLVET